MLYESSWTSGGNNWHTVVHQSEIGGTTTTITDLYKNGHEISINKDVNETVYGGWKDIDTNIDCQTGIITTTTSHGSF